MSDRLPCGRHSGLGESDAVQAGDRRPDPERDRIPLVHAVSVGTEASGGLPSTNVRDIAAERGVHAEW